jgi:uncharacterized protein (UPF0333 family)
MRKASMMILVAAVLVFAAVPAAAQTANPLTKASQGDWAQYAVSVDNATVPIMNMKDQQRWRVVSVVQETGVRIDNYTIMPGGRTSMGGSVLEFAEPFEPVFEIARGAKIEVVSTTQETVTVKGKPYACTKTVRKVSRPLDAATMQSGWNGTSTIWLCPQIPVGGVVKIENQYESQLTGEAKPEKIKETWVLVDFGFKDWKE